METFTRIHQPITEQECRQIERPVALMYIDTADGKPVEKGYVVTSANYYYGRGAVMRTCFLRDGQYYTCEANIMHSSNGYIVDWDAFEFTQGNRAFTVTTKKNGKHANQSVQ